MNIHKLHIVLCFLMISIISSAQVSIDIVIDNLTCIEAIQQISNEAKIDLTMGDIKDSKRVFNKSYTQSSVKDILSDLTANENIGYSFDGGRIILFYQDKEVTLSSKQKKLTLSGYIYDDLSGETLIGANIYSKGDDVGTASNVFGYYSISIMEGRQNIQVSYIGYKTIDVKVDLSRNTVQNYRLIPESNLEEVVITGASIERVENQTKMSSVTLPIKELNTLPVIGGEVDIIKSLQLMPGVQSGNEGFAGLYVRGGSSDQNLILLDGVPIYNASHLFGVFSVFNADAIKSTELIKGGYPARYGGRLSSILDIRMKDGNMQEWGGQGSIGLISSKLTIDGPIIKDKMSVMISGRRTYADLIAKPFISKQRNNEGIEGTPGYYFSDFNAKANYKISNNDRIFFSFYNGTDEFHDNMKRTFSTANSSITTDESSSLSWGNSIAALRWNHIISPKLFANTTLTRTNYDFNVGFDSRSSILTGIEMEESTELYKYSSKVTDLTAKVDLDYLYSPAHTIRFGTEVIRHHFTPGVTTFLEQDLSLDKDTIIEGTLVDATKYMAYVEDEIHIGKKMKLNVGFNASAFSVQGKTYKNIEPRFLMNYKLAPRWSVKGSYTMMTQYLHLLTNSGIGLPTDLWVPPTKQVEPQRSWQGALGVAHTMESGIEVSIEGYYKKLSNLITYNEGASFLQTNNDWESKVTTGEGRSFGAEVLVQKSFGKTKGWIGYTLSKSDRQFDEINNGNRYPFKFDRRHDLSIVANHKLSNKITVGANWVYSSGAAVTLPRREFDSGNNEYYFGGALDYGTKNSFRQKAFHRLDLSISYFKKAKWGEHSFHFDIYNAYNRKNTFYLTLEGEYDFETDTSDEKLKEVTLLPIVPSFRWDFKF